MEKRLRPRNEFLLEKCLYRMFFLMLIPIVSYLPSFEQIWRNEKCIILPVLSARHTCTYVRFEDLREMSSASWPFVLLVHVAVNFLRMSVSVRVQHEEYDFVAGKMDKFQYDVWKLRGILIILWQFL